MPPWKEMMQRRCGGQPVSCGSLRRTKTIQEEEEVNKLGEDNKGVFSAPYSCWNEKVLPLNHTETLSRHDLLGLVIWPEPGQRPCHQCWVGRYLEVAETMHLYWFPCPVDLWGDGIVSRGLAASVGIKLSLVGSVLRSVITGRVGVAIWEITAKCCITS